jgi:hypothetical protein
VDLDMPPPKRQYPSELPLIMALLLLLLFASPLADWWAAAGLHWSAPYGLWLLVIFGAYLVARRDRTDGT